MSEAFAAVGTDRWDSVGYRVETKVEVVSGGRQAERLGAECMGPQVSGPRATAGQQLLSVAEPAGVCVCVCVSSGPST